MSGFGITGFGSDNSSQSSLDYIRDAFADITKAADSNAGLTSNANTNPLGQFFANDAAPRYGAKTLFVKSIDLVQDRTKWVGNQPTYEITWHEKFPSVKGYCYGNAKVVENRNYNFVSLAASTAGVGFGVGGVIRQVKWMVGNNSVAVSEQIDGSSVGTFTPSFSPLQAQTNIPVLPLSVESSISGLSLQTLDLHDFRIALANASEGLSVYGVVVYFQNANSNIQTVSGDVYLDKEKISTVGSSLAVASPASMRGGGVAIEVTPTSAFSNTQGIIVDANSACNGLIDTNLINVSAGTGSQYPPGSLVFAQQGATHYIGNVLSVSTDVLTMGVTLPFALSGTTLSLLAQAGTTFSTSSYEVEWEYKFDKYGPIYNSALYNSSGTSAALNAFFDSPPNARYRVWGASCYVRNVGNASVLAGGGPNFELLVQNGSLFQVDGRFSALEIDFRVGSGTAGIGCTFLVDGIPCFNLHEAPGAGVHRRVILSNAGPGFHTVRIQPGASMLNTTISAVRGYRYPLPVSGSNYPLGGYLQGQTFIPRNAQSASLSAFGPIRRHYADQIPVDSSTGSTFIGTAAGGARIEMSANTDNGSFNYYGTGFCFVGTKGATFTCLFDGVAQNFSFGQWVGTGTSLSFHSLVFQGENGQTTIIEAIDTLDASYEMENIQQFSDPYYELDPSSFQIAAGIAKLKEGGIKRSALDPRPVCFSNYFGHTFTGNSLGQTAMDNTTVSIVTHGGPVALWVESLPVDPATAKIRIDCPNASTPDREVQLRFNRDGSTASGIVAQPLFGETQNTALAYTDRQSWPTAWDMNPPPGLHTYSLGAIKTGFSTIVSVNGRLFVRELY